MSFYVYLFSNSTTRNYDRENTILNFVTELSRPLEFSSGKWEVALVQISYPKLQKVNNLFFFIYTDIVEFSYVGSTQYQLLRPVLLKNTDTDSVLNTDHFVNPYYIPVCKKVLKSIEIQIEPDLVLPPDHFSLSIGDVCLVLHFKKRK